jgi:hypothetical protein
MTIFTPALKIQIETAKLTLFRVMPHINQKQTAISKRKVKDRLQHVTPISYVRHADIKLLPWLLNGKQR